MKAGRAVSTILRDPQVYTSNPDRSGKSCRIASCTSPVRPLHWSCGPALDSTGTNEKFRRRFAHIEASLASEGRTPATASLDEMERLWVAAKTAANGGGSRPR